MKVYVAMLIVLLSSGCAAPGAPKFRTDPNDGGGPLVQDCNNIVAPTRLTTYDTAFYHTTWSSVWIEASQSAARQGLTGESNEKKWVQFEKRFAYDVMMSTFGLDGRNYPFLPYCTTFRAANDEVDKALNNILPLLGNKILASDEKAGLYGTEFIEREHPGAKWRDRYIITLQKSTTQLAVVTVFRQVYISRSGDEFEMAMSDGHNETWILAQIAEETGARIGGK